MKKIYLLVILASIIHIAIGMNTFKKAKHCSGVVRSAMKLINSNAKNSEKEKTLLKLLSEVVERLEPTNKSVPSKPDKNSGMFAGLGPLGRYLYMR